MSSMLVLGAAAVFSSVTGMSVYAVRISGAQSSAALPARAAGAAWPHKEDAVPHCAAAVQASMLIPISTVGYTLAGGLKATFLSSCAALSSSFAN